MKNRIFGFMLSFAVLLMSCDFSEERYYGESENVKTETASVLMEVPLICQNPMLPTGCEVTSATMLLQYWGENISHDAFASDWLECDNEFYKVSGVLHGPDPDLVFAGDPFSEYSYGCYEKPIVDAVNQNSTVCEAVAIRNKSLDYICDNYIDQGFPVLIWATMEMSPSYKSKRWVTKSGTEFTWIAGEHCLVLVGYGAEGYYFNDPLNGKLICYSKDLTKKRYEELGKRAVVITPASD